jgi:hypothetical protein
MERRGVLVVGETPSLGRSIADLLESGGIPVQYVLDLGTPPPLSGPAHRYGVIIAACNVPHCVTVHQWSRGPLSNLDLVVVGARDAAVIPGARLHLVELPLLPSQFLGLIRQLLEGATDRLDVPDGTS